MHNKKEKICTSTFFKQRSTEGEGEGVRGSVKLKALVRWRLAKNVVQLELTNSVLLLNTRELASCG